METRDKIRSARQYSRVCRFRTGRRRAPKCRTPDLSHARIHVRLQPLVIARVSASLAPMMYLNIAPPGVRFPIIRPPDRYGYRNRAGTHFLFLRRQLGTALFAARAILLDGFWAADELGARGGRREQDIRSSEYFDRW